MAHVPGEETTFAIHEVYYDKDGRPEAYTENAVCVWGDNLEELALTLAKMQNALNKPILRADDQFPKEFDTGQLSS